MHVHKHYHNIALFSLGIVLLGGSIGGVGGLMGQSIFTQTGASSSADVQLVEEERTILRAAQRRRNFQRKLQERLAKHEKASPSPSVFPIQSSLLSEKTDAEKLDVTLAYAEIAIPSLHIVAPVNRPSRESWDQGNWKILEKQMQFGHNNGVSLYPNAPENFQETGNLVITGHSSPPTFDAKQSVYGSVFSHLPEIVIGDRIEVSDRNGSRYTYAVTETKIVHPSETSILKQGIDRELTLMTCYPVGTTQRRFIVKAKLVEEMQNVAVR